MFKPSFLKACVLFAMLACVFATFAAAEDEGKIIFEI